MINRLFDVLEGTWFGVLMVAFAFVIYIAIAHDAKRYAERYPHAVQVCP